MEGNKCNRCFASVCFLLPCFPSFTSFLPFCQQHTWHFLKPKRNLFFFLYLTSGLFPFSKKKKRSSNVVEVLLFSRSFEIYLSLLKEGEKERVIKQILLYRSPAVHECCSVSVVFFCKSLQVNASDHEKMKKREEKRRIINITVSYSSFLCNIRQSPLVTSFDVDPPSKRASLYVKHKLIVPEPQY